MTAISAPDVVPPRDHLAAEPSCAAAWVIEYVTDAPLPLSVRCATSSYPTASFTTDDRQVFVAGTIFDARALAARLDLPTTANLAHIVHAAYRQYGEAFVDRIPGRFVLLIADRASRRLLAVRDQVGLFPLFFARTGRGLLLSTSTAALGDQPEVTRALNRIVVAEHLAHRWVEPTETYFAAVRRVPPGHLLDVRDGHESVRRYWDPGADGPDEQLTDEEAIDRFNAALRQAVTRCLGAARTGILLSGGFDSVSIAATAAAIMRDAGGAAPHALSVGFPDPECDEEVIQRAVAQTLGLTQDLLPLAQALRGRGLLAASLAMGRSWPAPMLNIWAPAYFELSRRGVREGCDTILNGTGGDEWLNVTPCIAADLIRAGQFRQLARFVGVFQRSFKLTKWQVLRNALWTFGMRRLIGGAIADVAPRAWHASRHRREIALTPPWVAPDQALRREMNDRVAALIPPARPGKGGFYDRELQVSLTHPLVAMEYEEHFEFGQRVGAPLFSPYLDPDLVRVLYRMSPLTLTIGKRSKGLVRSAMDRSFPGVGFERHKKVNANSFFRDVVGAEGPAEWKRHGGAPELVRMGVLDGQRFGAIARELFAGRRREQNYLIWDILNVDGWVRLNATA